MDRNTDVGFQLTARVAVSNRWDAWKPGRGVYILLFNKHGGPQTLTFLKADSSGRGWHIVPAYVSAEMTGLK